jgi:hypothetical protein
VADWLLRKPMGKGAIHIERSRDGSRSRCGLPTVDMERLGPVAKDLPSDICGRCKSLWEKPPVAKKVVTHATGVTVHSDSYTSAWCTCGWSQGYAGGHSASVTAKGAADRHAASFPSTTPAVQPPARPRKLSDPDWTLADLPGWKGHVALAGVIACFVFVVWVVGSTILDSSDGPVNDYDSCVDAAKDDFFDSQREAARDGADTGGVMDNIESADEYAATQCSSYLE